LETKVFQKINNNIINFLSQIENVSQKIWEKKGLVLKTEYVITTDRIPEEFYTEILENKNQLDEWKKFNFKIPESKEELKNKKLPIDTKYFNQEFKEKLLEKLSENADLDDLLDGLLIKGENFRALNTILKKYGEKIQTVYIDPPFNKEQNADYLYKVKYKDSTWISFLENRLKLARELLSNKGSIFVRCDYKGNMYVRLLMNEIFGEENFRNEIVIKRTTKLTGAKGSLNVAVESLFFFSKSQSILFKKIQVDRICRYCKQPKEPEWIHLNAPGEEENDLLIINGRKFYARKNSHWVFRQEVVDKLFNKGELRINENKSYIDKFGNRVQGVPEYLQYFHKIDNNWTDIPGYEQNSDFPTRNSEILLKRVIESTSNEEDLVLDFFLGSGTTTAVAHKLGRKWIGIEMGEHFETIVLPRMKKVLAYDKSGISKEKEVKEKYNEKTAGGFFKYQILEQYEDSLENTLFERGG